MGNLTSTHTHTHTHAHGYGYSVVQVWVLAGHAGMETCVG
jgi:hypothetical protein